MKILLGSFGGKVESSVAWLKSAEEALVYIVIFGQQKIFEFSLEASLCPMN